MENHPSLKSRWSESRPLMFLWSFLAIIFFLCSVEWLGEASDVVWPPSRIPGAAILTFLSMPIVLCLVALASRKVPMLPVVLLSVLTMAGSRAVLISVGAPPEDFYRISRSLNLTSSAMQMYISDHRRLPENLPELMTGGYLSPEGSSFIKQVKMTPLKDNDFRLNWSGKLKVKTNPNDGDSAWRVVEKGTLIYSSSTNQIQLEESKESSALNSTPSRR